MQIGQGVVGDPRGHLEEAAGAADGHAAHDEEEGREVDLAELGAVEEPDAGEEGRKVTPMSTNPAATPYSACPWRRRG
ncbi:MAG: hypothetical protein ACLSHC_10305 [Bilophila wadsworthia]